MNLTCFECGFVGDIRTLYDIPNEPGVGICKDLDFCRARKAKQDANQQQAKEGA